MASNAPRESIAKNALIDAKEAAKRFPELKLLCKKFINTFQKTTEKPDAKHGHYKYRAVLQDAANLRVETIFIDLTDVEEFCKQEIQEPDPEIADQLSINKVQLQQSIEMFIRDIETNTLRFALYFYEACSALLPARDENFNADQAVLAKDAIQQWRERLQQQMASGGPGEQTSIPPKLKNSFDVRFRPRASGKCFRLRQISADNVGSLVKLDCLVVRVGQVKPKVEVVTYHCEICGAEIFQSTESETYTPPRECPSQRCKDNKMAGKLRSNIRTCRFSKHQEIRVQEMSEHVPVGGVPRAITAILTGDITRTVLPGDAITLTGIFAPYNMPWFMSRKQGTTQSMFIDAHSVVKHKKGYNDGSQGDDGSVERMVDEALARGDLYENAAKSIAPEIFGHLDVKKALLMVLVGSFTKNMPDGMKIRGDIHTLLMGDPGVAKSQLLKQVVNIAPRSIYTTGKGSSGVGLTAAVVRDSMTGEVTLEGGALVLADMGICCIDEFDKMEEGDRTAIHEVMEQQSVSIAKAGITTSLNCRTTVLAAANPAYGRYNPYKSPTENMALPAALLSRFDLLFLLLDTVECDKDKQLALHVCKVHSSYDMKDSGEDKVGSKASASTSDEADVLNLGFRPFDATFMRTYIRKARTFEPLISDELKGDICNAYVSMREDEKRTSIDTRKSYTTPRTLLAILRLSQAHARTRFSHVVEREDFEEAMRLMRASKESIAVSAPSKEGNQPLDIIYDIIATLSRQESAKDGWVQMAHVIGQAALKAMNREHVEEAIENWESLNVLIQNPEKTMVRFCVAAGQ